jgi:hypothetical protein
MADNERSIPHPPEECPADAGTCTSAHRTKLSEERPKDHRPEICAYIEALLTSADNQIDEFGKTVLTMSAGGLGISFAFVEKIVKPENMTSPGLLLLAWLSWAFSIALILYSFYTSHLANTAAAEDVRSRLKPYRGGKTVPHLEELGYDYESFADHRKTRRINSGAGYAFLLGVVLLVAFVASNLLQPNKGQTPSSATNQVPAGTFKK